MTRLLLLAAVFLGLPAAAQSSFINEIHYDNDGGDVGEAVEVVTPAGTDVTGWTVVLYNGNGGVTYDTDPLGTAVATDVGGKDVYVINYPANGIQNGAPDGLALVNGAGTVVQFLSYEGSFTATNGPANGQTSTDIGVAETTSTPIGQSLQLSGTGTDYSDFTWQPPATSTFGAANNDQTFAADGGDPTVTQQLDDGAGFRLLAAPVQGYTVGDLAGLNLVQGVEGQYPDADDNVFVDYTPTTTNENEDAYVSAASTADALEIGRGFFWYLFDNRVDPADTDEGGGTSESFPVSERPLAATGPVATTDVSVPFAQSLNGSYMIGNPFADPLEVTGIGFTGTGTFGTNLSAWDPNVANGDGSTGSYIDIDRTQAGTFLAVWQGVFAEIDGGDAAGGSFTYDFESTDDTQSPTFYGRTAPTSLTLALAGRLAPDADDDGVSVADRAVTVRVREDAVFGWDRHDATKLLPPLADYALLSFNGTRGGQAVRQSVLSLGAELSGSVEIPLSFRSTRAGSFTVTPEGLGALPGWTATLVDDVAKTRRTLVEGTPLTFDAPAGDWTDRFAVVFAAASTAGEDGPDGIEIGAVRPNPSVGTARLVVRTSGAEAMTATVFDALGRQVAVAFDGVATGETTVSLPSGLAPGVYVVRVQGESFGESRQFVVTR